MENFIIGLSTVLTLDHLTLLFFGVLIGLIVGAIPGLNGNMAIALLIPLTFTMKPTGGLVILGAIYCAAAYGGSIAAILIGVPGTISSIVTTFDGFPMAQKGQAGKALGIATYSSVFGGIFSTLVLILAAPSLAMQALKFGPAEYFALTVLGLSCISSISRGSLLKGLISGVLGLIISCIGIAPQTGYSRFIFNNFSLLEGVPFMPALIGLFGVTAVLKIVEKSGNPLRKSKLPNLQGLILNFRTIKKLFPTWIRSAIIGTGIGIIPGAGTSIATFLSYEFAKEYSKNPEEFGKGAEEGIAASEAANNGVVGGSLVPLLALGVPGNSTSALFLGALMIHGIRTGPTLFIERPDIIYTFLVSLFIANIIMAPLGLFVARFMGNILYIPKSILGSIIIAICTAGTYSIRNNIFDITVLIIFGVIGYVFDKFRISIAPFILGLVLGPMMELSIQQALVISRGSYSFLWRRPITFLLLLLAILIISKNIWPFLFKKRKLMKK